MSQGVALTDADRWDWLIQLREEAVLALDAGAAGVILTCSALKRKYRDVIRVARYNDHDVRVHFIYLRATEALLTARVAARKGHYMKPGMVRSQLQSLEEPSVERERDVHSIDVSGTQSEVREMAVEVFESVMLDDWHAMD
jgi:gluconokinase